MHNLVVVLSFKARQGMAALFLYRISYTRQLGVRRKTENHLHTNPLKIFKSKAEKTKVAFQND